MTLPTENADGSFTDFGMQVLGAYARAWVSGKRNLEIERNSPELTGTFYDIRADGELAARHALPDAADLESALAKSFGAPQKKAVELYVVQ